MKRFILGGFTATLAVFAVGCAATPHQAANDSAANVDRSPAAKPMERQGRDNLEYRLDGAGKLSVVLRNGVSCDITTNVDAIKMLPRGAHVMAYETKAGELTMLRMGDDNATQCYSQKNRKTDITDQQARVIKWNVISAAEVPVVLIALDKNGFVKMYDVSGNEVSGLGIRNVEDYRLHPCHGKKGIPFNSKIAFAYGNGRVGTIEPNGRFVLDGAAYRSAEDFLERNNISQETCRR